MTDYTITTNFGAKDSLPSGNAGKVIKGSEFTTEFTNIQTAVNTKADTAGDTFTGVVNFSADVAVNTNTLFVDVSEDKVGIGTNSPSSYGHSLVVANATSGGKTYATITNTNVNQFLNLGINADVAEITWDNGDDLAFGTTAASTDEGQTLEVMRIAASGNVGIGTNSPQRKLTVESEVRIQGTYPKLEFVDTDNNPDFTIIGGNAQLQIYDETNSATRMLVDASGNVGIGASSPSGKIHSVAANNQVAVMADGDVSDPLYPAFGFDGQIGSNGGRGAGMYLPSDGTLAWSTVGTERMRIDSSGNVLVGTTDNSPVGNNDASGIALLADGSGQFSRDGGTALLLNRKTSDGELLRFNKDGTAVGSIGTQGGDLDIGTDDTAIRFNNGIDSIFPVTAVGGSARDAAVDLGFSGARYKDLYLSSGVYLGGTAGGSIGTTSTNLNFSNNNNLALRIKNNGEVEVPNSIGLNLATSGQTINVGHLYVHADNSSKAALYVNNGQSAPSQFKMFASNKNEIKVNNAGEIAFQTEDAGGFRFEDNAFQPAGSTTGLYVTDMFNTDTNTTADLGASSNRWNNIYLSNNPNVSSDQRLKENIVDADDAGTTIDSIQVRKFDWIEDGRHQSYGMIAQELAEVYPEAVSVPENDEDTLGIAYADLIPMLIKEVQSLRSRVAELENV